MKTGRTTLTHKVTLTKASRHINVSTQNVQMCPVKGVVELVSYSQNRRQSKGKLASGSTRDPRHTTTMELHPFPLPNSGVTKLFLKQRHIKVKRCQSQRSHRGRKRTNKYCYPPLKSKERHLCPYQFTIIAALFSAMNGSSPLAFIMAKKKIQRMYWGISYKLVLLLRARKQPSPGSVCSSVSAPGHHQLAVCLRKLLVVLSPRERRTLQSPKVLPSSFLPPVH